MQQQGPAPKPPADDAGARFVSQVLRSTEVVWTDVFKESGRTYQPPKLVLFSGSWPTACGQGEAAMGPFYCPNDQKVYIDLRFYKVLEQKLGAPGQFAQAYVIAHEVGHHVQNQLGIMDKVEAMRGRGGEAQANAISVRVELQADCFAGVWAARSQKEQGWRLEPGDIETALNAAAADRRRHLAAQVAAATVVPETFTHGTSAQRVNWFKRGVEGGSVDRCNTFEGRGDARARGVAALERRAPVAAQHAAAGAGAGAARRRRRAGTAGRCRPPRPSERGSGRPRESRPSRRARA